MAGFTCLAAGAREFAGFPGRARHGAPSLVVGGCGGVHAPGYRPGLVESGHRFRIRGVRGCRCVAAAIRARWMFDVRFGCKTDAIGLLLEWVSSVGAEAGLTARNTHIGSGLVGSPGEVAKRPRKQRVRSNILCLLGSQNAILGTHSW